MFEEVEAWPESVDSESLLNDISHVFKRYVDLAEGNAEVLTLWTAFTYLHHRFQISPILAITSPVKGCGKTQLLTILTRLVNKPVPTSNITPASIYHSIDKHHPTLLIDEGDTFIRNNSRTDSMRGILNSGHNRSLAFVQRHNQKTGDSMRLSTWAPKAIALIGSLPSTVTDRSIVIRMHKRDPDVKIERLNQKQLKTECEILKQKLLRWAQDVDEYISEEGLDSLNFLSDRAEDNWRPLIAIARAAGSVWLERAVQSARLIANRYIDDEEDIGLLLLMDLENIYKERGADKLSSDEITTCLKKIEYRPWSKYSKYQISRIISIYGVRSKNIRYGVKIRRGYYKEDLLPLWKRCNATNRDETGDSVADVASEDDNVLQPRTNKSTQQNNIEECSNVAEKDIEDLTDEDLDNIMDNYLRRKNVIN